jgi:hypothetical protein
MRRQALVLAALAALALPGAAGSSSALTIHFSFETFANNVRVVAPLVGPWQLGTARLHGSGTLGGGVAGTIVGQGKPSNPKYAPSSLRAHVIGYHYAGGAHGSFSKLTLDVEVDSATNGGPKCLPGVRGIVTVYDSKAPLASNGQPSDYVTMGHWTAARCPTFVQGWTNEDGGPRTSPARGGPRTGGQWAVVRVTSS